MADNGGPTETIALIVTVLAAGAEAISAVNPAIDAGDAATCDGAPVNGLDQRGFVRPTGGNCDGGPTETIALIETVQAAGAEAISAVNPAIDAGDAAICDGAPVDGLDQRGFVRPTGGNCDGGPTETIALIETVLAAGAEAISAVNPAIDAGDAAICDGAPVDGLDQRGFVRPTGGNCDIGAFELNATPLAVTLSYFLAEANGDTVDFVWQTATEIGTAGFNLLAEDDGGMAPLNDSLIPSPVIDSVEPTGYRFSAQSAATIFYLEEIDISGVSERHGPFSLGEVYGVHTAIGPEGEAGSQSIYLPVVMK